MNDEMLEAYADVRLAIKKFELAIERYGLRSDREDKLADKSLVVLKVGAKLLKQILRERGFKGRLKPWPKDRDIGFHKP
jgi:hypothetical protein